MSKLELHYWAAILPGTYCAVTARPPSFLLCGKKTLKKDNHYICYSAPQPTRIVRWAPDIVCVYKSAKKSTQPRRELN